MEKSLTRRSKELFKLLKKYDYDSVLEKLDPKSKIAQKSAAAKKIKSLETKIKKLTTEREVENKIQKEVDEKLAKKQKKDERELRSRLSELNSLNQTLSKSSAALPVTVNVRQNQNQKPSIRVRSSQSSKAESL